MYHYNFTNDLRITYLDEILKEAANAFLTDTIPSADKDKSKNNNFMTVGFYFNLKAKGNCAKLASQGNIKKVVLNFIKKFQFPNPRTSNDYENSVKDKILLTPMRDIVKLLHILSLNNRSIAFLTKEEIKNFIFYNEDLAKRKNYNLLNTANQIIQYRKDSKLPENIDTIESEHFWNQPERQIREMIKTLNYTGCFLEDENGIRLKTEEITRDNEADLFEIINCDTYWHGKTLDEYQKYMDEFSMKEGDMENKENNILPQQNFPISYSQLILYGVPGSGKSYAVAKKLAGLGITPENAPAFTKRVVFHPEYTNADFVGQILPRSDLDGNKISYPFVAGPFTQLLSRAYTHKNQNFALIIEEINRGNAAAIFGELFQLLDRLEQDEGGSSNGFTYTAGWSSYPVTNDSINNAIREAYDSKRDDDYDFAPFIPKKNFDDYKENIGIRLPPNFSIFATMNTSDQNVFKLDNAFKRRFELELIPNSFGGGNGNLTAEETAQRDAQVEGFDFTWNEFREAANEIITSPENSFDSSSFADRQIGCWFAKAEKKSGADTAIRSELKIPAKTFVNKVLEYMWDDACGGESEIFFNKKYKTLAELINAAENGEPDIFSTELRSKIESKKSEQK